MRSLQQGKKWLKMLRGKSILHVMQDEGKVFSRNEVRGYYNNFTDKLLKPGALVDETGLVYNLTNEGKHVYFSIAIFQYGLGAYDLYLITGQEKYRRLFMRSVNWAIQHQQSNGAWDTFSVVGMANPYSAMAQGEGASLLARAYVETGNADFLRAAKQAVDFMCLSVADGGCSQYSGDKVWYKEYIDEPVVLNGWIFSIWGVYDYFKASRDCSYWLLVQQAVHSLAAEISAFDGGYWSKYDMGRKMASPFYHQLHISQLRVMYTLFEESVFLKYAEKWERYQQNQLYASLALVVKGYQKLAEKSSSPIVIVG